MIFTKHNIAKHSSNMELWKGRHRLEVCSSEVEEVGESTSVSKEMTAPWNETTIPTLFSNYKMADIYNAVSAWIKRITSPVRNVLVVKAVKFG